MEDLLKELAQAKPPALPVDRERMESDLARIIALPRTQSRRSFKRFAPVLVAAAVIALVVVLLPKPTQPVQPAASAPWWHALTQEWSLMVVGNSANPYIVRLDSKTDRWQSRNSQVTVLQKDGTVEPFSQDDDAKWEAAGKPATVPQAYGSHAVRIGPMKPAVQQSYVSGFQMSLHSPVRLDSFDALPADPVELKKTLATLTSERTDYRIASLAMDVMTSNVRADQRQAAFELLKTLDGARVLNNVLLRNGRYGIGVAITAPAPFQFYQAETQFVINPETGMPILRRDVLTVPQFGMPAGEPISEEEYLLLEATNIDPIVPQDVPVNGEVESPIIER
ncbi:hypothetical protein UK23_20875 [Lentzea aerocolonigenes]|uniref:Uncharacterized protein n=1 Tax=Lentzea aerocolonigenes TaxID=68170 RepID=A0A0F0GXE1_LENAE|nr:hypothetical protein [Lentzea aerocolonigenes]KJK47251.1 hypothetical protein UK23_20875 [Lentzea aerocolonigenes]